MIDFIKLSKEMQNLVDGKKIKAVRVDQAKLAVVLKTKFEKSNTARIIRQEVAKITQKAIVAARDEIFRGMTSLSPLTDEGVKLTRDIKTKVHVDQNNRGQQYVEEFYEGNWYKYKRSVILERIRDTGRVNPKNNKPVLRITYLDRSTLSMAQTETDRNALRTKYSTLLNAPRGSKSSDYWAGKRADIKIEETDDKPSDFRRMSESGVNKNPNRRTAKQESVTKARLLAERVTRRKNNTVYATPTLNHQIKNMPYAKTGTLAHYFSQALKSDKPSVQPQKDMFVYKLQTSIRIGDIPEEVRIAYAASSVSYKQIVNEGSQRIISRIITDYMDQKYRRKA